MLRFLKASSEYEVILKKKLFTGQILDLEVEENKSRGRSRKCSLHAIKDDLGQGNLQAEICQNCIKWRQRLKIAKFIHALSM